MLAERYGSGESGLNAWSPSTGLSSQTPACGPRTRRFAMKIVVIGGTGLLGAETAPILEPRGHGAGATLPTTRVYTTTGPVLKTALPGTQNMIDAADFPRFEDNSRAHV